MNSVAFNALIDAGVARLVLAGTESFAGLLLSLPGVYPTDVFDSLARLVLQGIVPQVFLLRVRTEVRQSGAPTALSEKSPLPVPHPLDFCWRFNQGTASQVLHRCCTLVRPGETVILLGAPSVVLPYRSDSHPYKIAMIDSDPAIVSSLSPPAPGISLLCSDLTSGVTPNGEGSAVIADPPWYPEYMRHFLWVACRLCRLGGHILFCFPPEGTRPEMEEERVAFDHWSDAHGLRLVRTENFALRYCSPPFERNALASHGMLNIPSDWRRAHLLVFRRERDKVVPRPAAVGREDPWEEFILSGVRIRVRNEAQPTRFSAPSLLHLIEGDVLPSVSRRYPLRTKADVWTSGNRIFACHGRATLASILRAMTRGLSPPEMIAASLHRSLTKPEIAVISQTTREIEEIVRAEQVEIRSYYEG